MADNTTLEQLNEVIKEFIADEDLYITASPGTIKNNGKTHVALRVAIYQISKNKLREYIYRENWGGFRAWLKEKINKLKND